MSPQRALYDPKHTRHDLYEFKVNSGGELQIPHYGESVRIWFRDGSFERAEVPLRGQWTRGDWRILQAVAEQITAIENMEATP